MILIKYYISLKSISAIFESVSVKSLWPIWKGPYFLKDGTFIFLMPWLTINRIFNTNYEQNPSIRTGSTEAHIVRGTGCIPKATLQHSSVLKYGVGKSLKDEFLKITTRSVINMSMENQKICQLIFYKDFEWKFFIIAKCVWFSPVLLRMSKRIHSESYF
jgi:hypothetical protein